jgi:hypothetical protein
MAYTASSSSPITYEAIMALQNSTFHHECFISVIQDATIPDDSSQPNETATNSPIIYCNFVFPIGLNATVEIKDLHCSQFTEPSSNTTIYNEGEATAILKPTITPEEKTSGTFVSHEYCARIDILFDRNGDGIAESVLYNHFMIPITYRFEKSGSGDSNIVSANVDNGNGRASSMIVVPIIGAIVGSLITSLLVLLIRRWRRYRSNRRKEEQTMNAEGSSVPKGLLI